MELERRIWMALRAMSAPDIVTEVGLMGDTKFRQTNRRTALGPYRRDLREIRRKEGDERNLAWAALTDTDKIASLRRRRGESKRQMTKLGAA